MKKSTSVILSVLMVISLFGCLFTGTTVTAESTAANLIVNGDFESFDVNTEHNNTALPGLDNRSVNSVFPTDKTKGQWYRSGGGLSPLAAPDLKEDYKIYNPTEDKEYPTYFGANNQRVLEPGSDTNHVLRAVQDLYTQVEPKDNGEYALTFRFKLPNNDTGLSYFDLFFVSPKLNSENGQSIQNNLKYPFSITSAELGNKTTTGITATLAVKNDGYKYNFLRIKFDETNTDWQTVEVAIKTEKVTHENAKPDVYKVDETDYTSPVLVKIGFGTDGINLTDKITTDEPITNATSYRKKAIYFDDFAMYEVVNCVGAAEFYDVKGNKLDNEQAYTKVTTTVNNTETSTIYSGDEVTATVKYDKDSGAYFFLGWYDETGAKVSTSETFTFTATAGETYTPRIGSANLLGGSGSFENYGDGENLAVALPTGISSVTDITENNIPNYSGDNKWATNENAGYLGATWPETIYDKDGKKYQQIATYKKIRLLNTFNVVEDAKIAKSGRKYLHIKGGAASSLGLENLNKNTDYKLSFYLRYSGVNANKIKSVGVTTTVNINNEDYNKNATLKSQGMLITLENAVPSHKITVAKCDSTELSKVSTTEWQKITVDFNSGNLEKLYLAIVSTSGAPLDYYIDDMVLVAMSSANVQFMNTKGEDITAECANEAKPAITNSAKPGYLVANADYEDNAFDFKGWYNGDTLLSTDKSFEFPNGAYTTLTAKVVSRNTLKSTASYEGYNAGTSLVYTDKESYPSGAYFGGNKNAGYLGQTKVETIYDNQGNSFEQKISGDKTTATNGVKATVTNVKAHSGEKSVYLENEFWTVSLGIDVQPNTYYTLSYYILAPKYVEGEVNTVGSSAIATSVNTGNGGVAPANLPLNQASDLYLDKQALTTVHDGENWIKVTHTFNSMNLDKVYLVICQTSISGKPSSWAYIDDLTCYATNLTAADLGIDEATDIVYKGASIRKYANAQKPQALRHKFEIKKELLTDNYNSLYGTLVEYGSVAIRTEYLGTRELVKDGVYNYQDRERKAVTGIAYQKGTIDKVFADTGDTKIFTAALTGIGKQAGTEELDYSLFAKEYAVRNYLIFEDANGKRTTVYTTTRSVSVFNVMYVIMTQGPTSENPKVQNDYKVLCDIFRNDANQKTAYETEYETTVTLPDAE